MLIDTHCHLNFKTYEPDLAQVLARCQERTMAVINVGALSDSSVRAVELAENNKNFYAALGQHPIHCDDEVFQKNLYQQLLGQSKKIVAIGETGLDFWHLKDEKNIGEIIEQQKKLFQAHIDLASEYNLPLILHGRNGLENRDVYREMLEILEANDVSRAVFHCFGGSLELAQELVGQGFFIGIDGPVTFLKKNEELQAIARIIPLEKLLAETDAPYLTPEPHRGERNEAIHVEWVVKKIAELKNLPYQEVEDQLWQNAQKLFNFEKWQKVVDFNEIMSGGIALDKVIKNL